jgi:hypothetical protein
MSEKPFQEALIRELKTRDALIRELKDRRAPHYLIDAMARVVRHLTETGSHCRPHRSARWTLLTCALGSAWRLVAVS